MKTLWSFGANAFRLTPADGATATVDMTVGWVIAATKEAAKGRAMAKALAAYPPATHETPVVAVNMLPRGMLVSLPKVS